MIDLQIVDGGGDIVCLSSPDGFYLDQRADMAQIVTVGHPYAGRAAYEAALPGFKVISSQFMDTVAPEHDGRFISTLLRRE